MTQGRGGMSVGRGVAAAAVGSAALAAAGLLLLVGCGETTRDAGQASQSVAKSPAMVLISVDGLAADELATPAVDAFAGGACRFDYAFAQSPLSAVSLASLYTSLYPTTHGLVNDGAVLRPEAETLAEVAAAAGMPTALFAASADELRERGLTQGFDTVADADVAALASWLSEHADGSFVLAVHLQASPDVALTDAAVAEILQLLREHQVVERSVVALVGSRGRLADGASASLTLDEVHVPLLVQAPGESSPAAVHQFVELIDVAPTMLALLGLAAPNGAQGASLLPLMRGEGEPPYIAFGELAGDRELRFVALGGHRMVASADGGECRLFNLEADPQETVDISGDPAGEQAVRRMTSDLEAWSKMVAAASLDPELRSEELDDETLEQLKSLGYIQ